MKTSVPVLALAAALSAPAVAQPATAPAAQPAPGQAPADAQPKPSPKATAAILALQAAINAKDTANIPAKLAAARAVATTPADRYWIARLQLNQAIAASDFAAAQQDIDAISATGALGAPAVAEMYNALGNDFLKAKQYDQAAAAFQKAGALAPNDPDNLIAIAQARTEQGRKAEAAAAIQRAIAMSKASGQKPSENLYRNAAVLAYQAKLPSAVSIARDWVSAYPSDQSWRNSLAMYRNLNGGDPDNVIDIVRLSRLTHAMQTANDYEAFASKSILQGGFAEAKSALDEGIAAGTLKASDPNVVQLLAATRGKIPTATELATDEHAARIPTAFLRVGDHFYGAGDYAKAATLYREALAKGVDPNLANLRLGEALARAGDKAGAIAALSAVGGARADLAKFWLLYVQTHA